MFGSLPIQAKKSVVLVLSKQPQVDETYVPNLITRHAWAFLHSTKTCRKHTGQVITNIWPVDWESDKLTAGGTEYGCLCKLVCLVLWQNKVYHGVGPWHCTGDIVPPIVPQTSSCDVAPDQCYHLKFVVFPIRYIASIFLMSAMTINILGCPILLTFLPHISWVLCFTSSRLYFPFMLQSSGIGMTMHSN